MEQKHDLAQDMMESEQEFRSNFDPKSKNYHHGDQTPIPINGQRVPESMPTVYDPSSFNQPQNVEYGPQYDNVVKLRDTFTELKKVLSKITQSCESVFRLHGVEDKQQDEFRKMDSDIMAARGFLGYIKENKKEEYYQEKFINVAEKILNECKNQHTTKESLTDFNFIVKNVSSLMFNETKKLLEEMKKIKKEHANKIAEK